MSEVMQQLPPDHPLVKAWDSHKQTNEFVNSMKWAAHPDHLLGSMWAQFVAGWDARSSLTTSGEQK